MPANIACVGRRLPINQARPTVDAVRKRLGGRALTDSDAGEIVRLCSETGVETFGVVLFSKGNDVDVWTHGALTGVVRRTQRAKLSAVHGQVPVALAPIAKDARTFARLEEGSRVCYASDTGEIGEAMLAEKCRYGALLLREDGSLIGVGFRRVWPVNEPSPRAN